MSPELVDWTPALAVLAAAIVAGVILLARLRSNRSAAAGASAAATHDSLEHRDLVAKRDSLIRVLRELDDTQAKRTPEQLVEERLRLETEAARVLLRLEALETPKRAAGKKTVARAATDAAHAPQTQGAAEAAVESAPGILASRPALRGFLWGGGSVAALALLVYGVSRSATPRSEGGSVTGNTPMDAAASAEASSPSAEETQLRAHLEKTPDDLEARLSLARLLLQRRDMMGVWNETKYVLERSPGNPRALSYQSLVRLAMGQADVALKMLQEALAAQPDDIEIYLHMTLVLLNSGKTAEATATIDKAAALFPDRADELRRLLAEMLERQQQGAVVADGENPHAGIDAANPGGPPPTGSAAQTTERHAASGPGIAGSVDLDPALRGRVPANAMVFVTVRAAGTQGGPPIAARRLSAASFPVSFQVGSGDSMMGDALPELLSVEARVDSDGDPMSRDPDDPTARLDSVRLGTTDIRLVLKR